MSKHCWSVQGTGGDGSCPRLREAGFCTNCPEYSEAGRKLFDREMDEGERVHWTRLMAEEKEKRSSGLSSVIVFRLGHEWLGLPAGVFDQILDLRTPRTVPGRSNRIFTGLVNVGGELLPRVSAREALRIPRTDSRDHRGISESCLAVVRASSGRFAFDVDEVLGVVRYDPRESSAPPVTVAEAHHAFACAIVDTGELSITLLDAESLFEAFDRSLAA